VTYTVAGAQQRTYIAWRRPGDLDSPELGPINPDRIETAISGPPPGAPGAWFGELCDCGEILEHYTPDGWPRCEEHRLEAFQPKKTRKERAA
jgi:hypothetical protein